MFWIDQVDTISYKIQKGSDKNSFMSMFVWLGGFLSHNLLVKLGQDPDAVFECLVIYRARSSAWQFF